MLSTGWVCPMTNRLSCLQYPEPGSNRHTLRYWCLRPTRLPIPPSGLKLRVQRYGIFSETPNNSLKNSAVSLILPCKDMAEFSTGSCGNAAWEKACGHIPCPTEGMCPQWGYLTATGTHMRDLQASVLLITSLPQPFRPSSWRDTREEPYRPGRRGRSEEERTS